MPVPLFLVPLKTPVFVPPDRFRVQEIRFLYPKTGLKIPLYPSFLYRLKILKNRLVPLFCTPGSKGLKILLVPLGL